MNLTLGWFLFYILLWTGSNLGGDAYSLRLLYANGLLTTGYIIISLALMWRVWRRESVAPGAFRSRGD